MPLGADRSKHLETLVGEIPDDVRAHTIALRLRLCVSRCKIQSIIRSTSNHIISLWQHLVPSRLVQHEVSAHVLPAHLDGNMPISGRAQL